MTNLTQHSSKNEHVLKYEVTVMSRHKTTIPEPISDLAQYEEKAELKQASIIALRELLAEGEASGLSSRSLEDIWEECKQNAMALYYPCNLNVCR